MKWKPRMVCLLVLAGMCFSRVMAGSFQGLSWSDSATVVVGQWTSKFNTAKNLAESKRVPLVVVWASSGCGWCKQLASSLGSTSSIDSWMKARGLYFVFALDSETADTQAAMNFARYGFEYPYCRVYFPARSVNQGFTGRSGKMHASAGSGTSAQQFMNTVDAILGIGSSSGGSSTPAVSTFTVTFNANGGVVSEKTRKVNSGARIGVLPNPTRSNYRFDGWFTSSTGGNRILSSEKVVKSVTYYAHWTKVYALTASCSPKEGGSVSGAGSFAQGEAFALKATATSGYVFSGWYLGLTQKSQETTYKGSMGAANLSLTAKFIKKTDDWVKIGAFKTAAEYETKKEIFSIALSATGGSRPTLSVSKLPSGLKFTAKDILVKGSKTEVDIPANTIYGTPTKSGIYSAQVIAKTAGGAKASAILPLIVRAENERVIKVDCDAKMGKVSGGGVFADGKKASVRATAASKHCFTGWRIDGELVSRSTSYSYPVNGKDVQIVAGFVSKEQDLASVSLALNGAVQVATHVPTNIVRCGVSNNWTVVAKALSGTTVTASGLPSGLKLVKPLVNKELKEYSYEIVGVPTNASKIDSKTKAIKPTVATIKVTTLGRSSVSYKVAFIIEALPTWAYGTFNGFAAADENGKGVGIATMTVSASGKISGKFGLFGTNWTYSATGYTVFVNAKNPAKMKFGFEAVAKYSKWRRPFVIEVTPGTSNCSSADGEGEDFAFKMYRKVWSDKPALISPKLPKTSLQVLGYDNLALTVSASGKATFAGKLNDGTSASSSSTVFVDEDGLYQTYLVIPAKKKYVGYIDLIDVSSMK